MNETPDAEQASVDPDGGLEAAVADNPEAVAAFVERLGLANQLLDVAELGVAAMDDEMVASLAGTAGDLGAAADAAATPETAKLASAVGENGGDLAGALETVARLERDGTLDDLAALGDVTALLAGALDDEMVASIARTGSSLGEVADSAADPDAARGLSAAMDAVADASDPDHPPERVGLLGLARALRDPDVQRGVGFLVTVAGALGENLDPER